MLDRRRNSLSSDAVCPNKEIVLRASPVIGDDKSLVGHEHWNICKI